MPERTDPSRVTDGSDTSSDPLLLDWDRLQGEHPTSSPFQSAGWLGAWRESYTDADVVTITSRHLGELEGAATFTAGRSGPARVLRAAPPGVSDYEDVVLGPHGGAAARFLDSALATPGWDALDFREVPPSADLWRVVPHWPGAVLRSPTSECVLMDGADLTEFAAALPKRKRHQLGQQQRGIARAGVTVERAEGDPEGAVRRLLALHAENWAGRPMNPEHGTPRFERLLVRALDRLGPRGRAAVLEYHQNGRVLGSAFFVANREYVGIYLTGHHPELREQVNLHVLDTVAGFELVSDLGLRRLNMLRGAEPYKLRLAHDVERSERVVLVRPHSAAGRAFGLAVQGRRTAATLVRGARGRLAAHRAARTAPPP